MKWLAGASEWQPRLKMHEVAELVKAATGYSLSVHTSAIHQAGRGLWMQGKAEVGAVVAFMPGVTYTKEQYRQIPGYPRIDMENGTLAARFDGSIVDSKPWGEGLGQSVPWPVCERNTAETRLKLLEGRNPFALGQFANHPGPEDKANVMLAPVDFPSLPEEEQWIRAYVPCLSHAFWESADKGADAAEQVADDVQAAVDQASSDGQATVAALNGSPISCLALVALRDLKDEELLLNYRCPPPDTSMRLRRCLLQLPV